MKGLLEEVMACNAKELERAKAKFDENRGNGG